MAITNLAKRRALQRINEFEKQQLAEAEWMLCERTRQDKASGHEDQLELEDRFEDFVNLSCTDAE